MNETTPEPERISAPAQPEERLTDPVEVAAEPATSRRGWAPPRGGRSATLVFVGLVIAGALLALWAWDLPPFRRSIQTTDNAYVRGQTTIIAPQVNGYVVAVAVRDFETVAVGQVLARIDDRIYRQRVEQARANVATQLANLANSQQSRLSREAALGGQQAAIESARAQLARAEADMRRVDELVAEGSVSLREQDQTRAALAQAAAGVRQAEAQRTIGQQDVRAVTVGRSGLEAAVDNARASLRLAEIDLANTVIRAPQAGKLGEVSVRLGQYVTAGSQLMFLVPPTVWVSANFKEAQTARIRPGQPAVMSVDALGGADVRGTVEQLSPAAGSEFSVIRPDNATGNFVKVPQRLTVRIRLDPRDPLYPRLSPGMSVEARVDTRANPAGPGRTGR
ncbi:secretion protein HlyD [Croceibacterium mercuriale]|uniref:Secretion protein HlyD n=1 Tax=Croceibacterium mercuriale TaxID=1572751 RepID=A0A0B2BZC4_9SPHN|nr:HlyD family secretion protein [Croceibacterium mercuriale]KHL25210.1 secretion protein HlyD [Croceibacterium mercuriale]